MLTFFRRVSNSKIGTWIMAAIGIAILGGFALGDISNFGSGNIGFGLSASTLATVGDQQVGEKEMSDAMQRHLQQVREQHSEADYASIIGDFDTMLSDLIDQKTLFAFADKFRFPLSKRLIDAEIAQIPAAKGLNGQFSQEKYQEFLGTQRLSDEEVRRILAGGLLERLLLTPVVTSARVSVGMARPYASMLLETREGEGAAIPTSAFRAGLKPTHAQVQQFYSANRNRYMVPEQRALRIARIGPDQVSGLTASDTEVTAYYNQNKAEYAAKETRTLSQAVVPDQPTANAIAARAKGGATIAAAAAPAGANAAVSTLNDQTQQAYAGVAGNQAAAQVFAAPSGAVVGPIHGDFGWVVVKVESAKTEGGKTAEQAHTEIAAKLTADKRKNAIEDLVDKVNNAVDNGSNFTEAAAAAKLTVTTTPLITADGKSRANPSFALPPELAPVLKSGFANEPSDPPEIVTLPKDQGYALVSPEQVVPAAPAPLASVHDQVANDWINQQALQRARAVATQIKAKVEGGMSLQQAVSSAGTQLPPAQPLKARRIQIATAQGPIPEPLKMLFTLLPGKTGMIPDPQGRGFFIVKLDKAEAGNALLQPSLIGQMQNELQGAFSDDYAREFTAALSRQLKVRRNESAIQGLKTRMMSSGG
jgi:peptidyl-prolyl cis-trans isomerase D